MLAGDEIVIKFARILLFVALAQPSASGSLRIQNT
jgi:hypothetical protein